MSDSNLLTYKEFNDVMSDIERTYEYSCNWNEFMYSNITGSPNIFQPDCTEISIFLLERMFSDDCHLITYFCKGLRFGKLSGNDERLHTTSDLYDLLMENIARKFVGSIQINPDNLGGEATSANMESR